MSIRTFLLPDLGEGLTEADLVTWLVKVGDTVVIDQPIAEVETAKSMVEVPSPYAGTVHQLHGAAGETMDVGKPLISVEDGVAAPAAAAAPATEGALTYREEERAGVVEPEEEAGSGNVLIGYGTPGGLGNKTRTRRPRNAATAVSTAPAAASAGVPAPLVISPIVRRMARENGIDVASLRGSGIGGLIVRSDVEAAISGGASAPVAAPLAPVAVPAPVAAPAAAAPIAVTGDQDARSGLGIAARTPMKGVRKTIAAAMSRSRSEIPEATVWVDVDATALLELRASMKASNPETTPGLLALIARFTLAGLAKYPELNTRIQPAADGGEEILSFNGVNLGFAAQTDRGLMVPSIQNADKLSARGIDAELKRLTAVARSGKATPQELTSGTFTLNNYGVFGVDGSAAIINYPEAAILGVGRIIDRAWVVDGELAVRKVTELTLTFDHRVCDGGTAGGFLRFVADAIENPMSVLADL
ncbi:dihydrolipoamide acetyltransferase family protein [Paeniglutamicibacter cryotolerans]|uniref:Dihydrolipoamide acetyltransferase component of pyruvate dehydrogenase complex n=1 Tax=Paeniglutamicibacter cryotolerans TaxID=670079 RepID=A0A839QER0_9MICC|nr:dihydrolipoamide acetyltransferase family protein [Paeniglutamicibacter cryotolerans]MBB2994117.1 pyruvate dehydrogenase E2 component (dihydrolipoamide acetyltransferase) [Paeniglutamicibacter cryotolerans]